MPMNEEEIKALEAQIAIYRQQLDIYELTGAKTEAVRIRLLIVEAEKDLADARPKPSALAVESVKKQKEPELILKEVRDAIAFSGYEIKYLEQDPVENKAKLAKENAKLTALYKKLGDMEDPAEALANRFKAEQQPEVKSAPSAAEPEAQEEDPVAAMVSAMNEVKAQGAELDAAAEAQANAIKAKNDQRAQYARAKTAGYSDSIEALKGYKGALKAPLKKGGVFQSNQVEKGNLAQQIINKMEGADPSNVTQMQELKIDIEKAIKDNNEATGVRLWNKGGNLNKHLNATLKVVETTIEVLNRLDEPKQPPRP